MKKLKMFIVYVIVIVLFMTLILIVERIQYNNMLKAIESGNYIKAEKMLDGPYFNLDRPGGEGWLLSLFVLEFGCNTPLELACEKGNVELVKVLIDKGADSTLNRYMCFSPLYLTLQEYHDDDYEIVKLLIENGADPLGTSNTEIVDNGEHSLLTCARTLYGDSKDAEKKVLKTYRYLEKNIKNKNPIGPTGENVLMNAVFAGNIPLINYILDNNICDINAINYANENCLFYVGFIDDFQRQKAVIDILYKNGVNFNMKNTSNENAYQMAKRLGNIELSKEILNYCNGI